MSLEELEDQSIDGTLEGAFKIKHGDTYSYAGRVYGDKKGRFPDGSLIQTSPVLSETKRGSYLYVVTKNSRYKVYLQKG